MARSYLILYTLNNIINKMENGSISTPAFQRGFVWNKRLVKSLFESVNKGYPIGLLLAVEGASDRFVRSSTENSYFPDAQSSGFDPHGTLWILDGSQRLAALYRVLRSKQQSLDLYYDLVEKEFHYEKGNNLPAKRLKMSALFDAKEFMRYQAYLAHLENPEVLINELNGIHNRFQLYEIPIQIISDVTDSEIIDIFTKLNVSGLTLKKEEVEKARKYKKPKEDS